MMKMNNRRILFLDYMRIFAFSLVVLGHKFNKDLASWASDPSNHVTLREGANKQVISSQADSLIKISRIWADFFPANTSNQPI